MNALRFLLLPALLAAGILAAPSRAATTISNFGTNIQPADLQGNWTTGYNSSTSTVTSNDGPGNGISDFTGPTIGNVTGDTALSLTAAVSVNPNSSFQLILEDNNGNDATANFNWASFGTSATTVLSPLTTPAGFNGADVIGWELFTGGIGSPLTTTFSSLSAVPEPSTPGLLIFASLLFATILGLGRRRFLPALAALIG